jgi:hypothetical protein
MATRNRTSRQRIGRSERANQALELRKAGKTFVEIGKKMGVSPQRAHALVTQELVRLNATRSEAAAEVCRLELERLDVLLAGLWGNAKAGDTCAVDRVLSIMARRAKLIGLDAPEKRELTGKGGSPLALTLSLEELVEADRQLEDFTREQQGAAGPSGAGVPAADPQLPA